MNKLRAIGYPRVSGTVQGESGYSLGDQVKVIEEYCARNDIELVAHFREVESAATVNKRPGFKAALQTLYRTQVDILLVTNLDRHSRSMLDFEIIKRAMARHGKRIVSIQEQYLTPLAGVMPDDDYLEAVLQHRMVDAESERKRIYKRCWRGRSRKVEEGGWKGHRPPYEYDVVQGELVQNTERWRIVRHMVRLRSLKKANGRPLFSWDALAQYFNGDNNMVDPVSGQRGRRFPVSTDKMTVKKRLTPYKVPRLGLWYGATCRRIVLEVTSGARDRWLSENLADAS